MEYLAKYIHSSSIYNLNNVSIDLVIYCFIDNRRCPYFLSEVLIYVNLPLSIALGTKKKVRKSFTEKI